MRPESKLPQPPEISDRQLGDEWLDWDGKSNPGITESGKGLFISFSILSLIILGLGLLLFHWLIQPRLAQFGTLVVQLGTVVIYLLVAFVALCLCILVLAVTTESPVIIQLIRNPSYLGMLLPWSTRLANWVGFSRDKVTNSFLKVHNLLTSSLRKPIDHTQLLILLPRCLNREMFQQLRALKEKYQVEMFTAGGGDVAREMIRKKKPKTIIAIACERDLVSGIRDVAPYIPVLGFPNKRPEGPCKNTEVDVSQIEIAIKTVLGRE
ncbi:MAG: DUF116 domain-containing protein [bacterium]|nr:DUF116 domain-containing protein [bacterium]